MTRDSNELDNGKWGPYSSCEYGPYFPSSKIYNKFTDYIRNLVRFKSKQRSYLVSTRYSAFNNKIKLMVVTNIVILITSQ